MTARYSLNAIGSVLLASDGMFVTNDPIRKAAFDAWVAAGGVPDPYVAPQTVRSQDLMGQFTTADVALIQAAIAGNAQLWLLWQSLLAQSDPMLVTSSRFQSGWAALTTVLGADRMAAIAAALGVTID